MTMDNDRIRLGGWAKLAIASSKKDPVKSQEKRTAIRLRFPPFEGKPQRIGRSKKKLKQSGYQRILHRSQKYEVVMSVVIPLTKVRGFKNESV